MNLVGLARNPIPSGAVCDFFPAHDGVPLRFARWEATRAPTRGTIVIFQGRGEFIEKYFEVVADLRRRGFAVATHDWRGQGGSHRPLANRYKGHVGGFSEYDHDIVRFMKEIVLPSCPPPYLVLAHSMGGNIALRASSSPNSWFERMVVCAPMLGFHRSKVVIPQSLAHAYVEIGKLFGAGGLYVPGGNDLPTEAGTFANNSLTSDAERFARNRQILEAMPELGLGSPTIGWLRSAYRSNRMLMDPTYAPRAQIPMLLVSAGSDRIVSTPNIEEFASRLKVGAHVLITRSEHEILQERDDIRAQFWAAFDAYLGITASARVNAVTP
ncbi:MAG: alpha/beta fold hydrolase [Hyphomicrobiaceae bacterium]